MSSLGCPLLLRQPLLRAGDGDVYQRLLRVDDRTLNRGVGHLIEQPFRGNRVVVDANDRDRRKIEALGTMHGGHPDARLAAIRRPSAVAE